MVKQSQSCLIWNSSIFADYLCFALMAPMGIVFFLVLSKWIWLDSMFSAPLLILYVFSGCFIVFSFIMLPRFHKKYILLTEGIRISQPFSKPVTYRWENIHRIDTANMRVNKSDFPIIRLFLQSPDPKMDKTDRSIDRYLWMSKSVLILSFNDERIASIRQFSNQTQ